MLNPLILPDNFRRDAAVPTEYDRGDFETLHDWRTLWYDAFWRDGRVYLVCPKLRNFADILRRGRMTLDGRPAARPRLRRYRRHDVVEFRAADCPSEIAVSHDGFDGGSRVSRAEAEDFAGLNAHVCISKNNELDWIRDFALYHKRLHGLQAMVLFDNASDRYGPEDIAAALAPVGLDRVVVVPAPFRYGPHGAQSIVGQTKYLQPALLNLGRLRFLARARAVLNADIDELIVSRGPSVFDAAADSRLGFACYRGVWRFPRPGAGRPARHADHTHILPSRGPASPKYCIAPTGPLGRLSWDIHKLDVVSFDKLVRRRDMTFYHCRAVSTGWKGTRRDAEPEGLVPDPEAEALMARAFGPPGQPPGTAKVSEAQSDSQTGSSSSAG